MGIMNEKVNHFWCKWQLFNSIFSTFKEKNGCHIQKIRKGDSDVKSPISCQDVKLNLQDVKSTILQQHFFTHQKRAFKIKF